MREAESSLQQFGEFLLKRQLVRQSAAPYVVRWVRQFLAREASDEPMADQVRHFCDGSGTLRRVRGLAGPPGRAGPPNLLRQLPRSNGLAPAPGQTRSRTRRAGRFRWRLWSNCGCASEPGTTPIEPSAATPIGRGDSSTTSSTSRVAPQPRVDAEAVRNYLTHLAVHRHVSASTQNQAMCAILFLCREVLGLNPDGLSLTPRAKRGQRLPVVLSIPETGCLAGSHAQASRGSWPGSSTAEGCACRSVANSGEGHRLRPGARVRARGEG